MPISVGVPAMKPRVERYKQQYVTAIRKITDWPKETLIRYEKAARSWRDLQGKTEIDRFHIAIYQAVNLIMSMRFPGTVAPWFSEFYNIQYGVKPERDRVYIESNPTGARMWIDDVDTYRSTPNLVYVARDSGDTSRKTFLPGWHRLKLRKSGFTDFIIDIYIGPGHGRDNPYKFGLSKPSAARTVQPARTLPSFPTVPPPAALIAPATPRQALRPPPIPQPSYAPPPMSRQISLPALPPPSMGPPAYRIRARQPLTPPGMPLPFPPPFTAGAKTSNTAFTFDGMKEPFNTAPPIGVGSLAQIRYRQKVFIPARFQPVTQEVLQSRLRPRTGRQVSIRWKYPAKDPWITDALIRQYAADVNTRGRARADASLNPFQSSKLYSLARARGYIEAEMAIRHLWVEERHKSPLIRYIAPYSPPVTQIPPPVSDPSRLVRPTTAPRVEPPALKIKQEAGRYYKQIGPAWMLVKDIRGRTPEPRRAGTARGSYAAGKLAQQAIAAKVAKQRGESFRRRAQQIRAALMRR